MSIYQNFYNNFNCYFPYEKNLLVELVRKSKSCLGFVTYHQELFELFMSKLVNIGMYF
jgi:hypothetical protein